MARLLVCAFPLLVACGSPPTKMDKVDAKRKAGLLMELDGCRVYRFYDSGNYHYFARCSETVSASSTRREYCGKNCYRTEHEEIPTEAAK